MIDLFKYALFLFYFAFHIYFIPSSSDLLDIIMYQLNKLVCGSLLKFVYGIVSDA